MKRLILPSIFFLLFSVVCRADDKPPRKEALPQKLSSQVNALNEHVENLQSDSESAGRRSRDSVDRHLSEWERQWNHNKDQAEKMWDRLVRTFYQIHRSIQQQVTQFEYVWHQVHKFFNSK